VYAVSPSDPATLAIVTLLIGGVSLAALYLPARRATRINPLVRRPDYPEPRLANFRVADLTSLSEGYYRGHLAWALAGPHLQLTD
jgi:hypothetical protein